MMVLTVFTFLKILVWKVWLMFWKIYFWFESWCQTFSKFFLLTHVIITQLHEYSLLSFKRHATEAFLRPLSWMFFIRSSASIQGKYKYAYFRKKLLFTLYGKQIINVHFSYSCLVPFSSVTQLCLFVTPWTALQLLLYTKFLKRLFYVLF